MSVLKLFSPDTNLSIVCPINKKGAENMPVPINPVGAILPLTLNLRVS